MTEQLAAMVADVEELTSKIERVVADGQLMQSTAGLSPGSGQPNQ
jgi:hypothetical protein